MPSIHKKSGILPGAAFSSFWDGPWDTLKEWYMNEDAEVFAREATIDGIPIRKVLDHSLIISLM